MIQNKNIYHFISPAPEFLSPKIYTFVHIESHRQQRHRNETIANHILLCVHFVTIFFHQQHNNNTYFSKSKWILTTLTIINWSYKCYAVKHIQYTTTDEVDINQDRREEIVLLDILKLLLLLLLLIYYSNIIYFCNHRSVCVCVCEQSYAWLMYIVYKMVCLYSNVLLGCH